MSREMPAKETGYVPADDNDVTGLRPDSMLAQLVETIGWAATIKFCSRFGGEQPYTPKIDSIYLALRNAAIVRDHKNGYSYPEISERHAIPIAHARVIVNRSL